MTFPAAGPVLFLLLAATAQQGALRDARIRIAITGDTAWVSARYRVTDAGDSLRFNALRVASQELTFDLPFRDPRLRFDTLPGLFRVTAAGRGRGLGLDLRYRVTGNLSRIPLFVPEAPAIPGQSRLVILVEGLDANRVASYPFPRFTRDAGPLLSTPDHLPSFVAVVAPAGGLPVPAIAQWSVLLIALGGTGSWFLAQLRARRRA